MRLKRYGMLVAKGLCWYMLLVVAITLACQVIVHAVDGP